MASINKNKPKLSFFHDNRFIYKENHGYYAATGFTDTLFEKYLVTFDSVRVVARHTPASTEMDLSKYDRISSKSVFFNCIDKLSVISLFFGKDRGLIKQTIKDTDAAIIRLPSIIGIAAALEARKQAKPYLIELVGCRWDSLWNYGKVAYKIVAPFLFLVDKMLVRSAKNVIYVSSNFLQNRYPTKGKSLACSDVELAIRHEDVLGSRLDSLKRIEDDCVIKLGTVAAVNMKYKGQQYVIKAISELVAEGHGFEYFMAGSGSEEYLKKLAKRQGVLEMVHFLGPIPHSDVFNFMSQIDIYIQPSNAESHGRVILEAFEAACPVIGSSTGGIPELVSQNFVFQRKNVNDLKHKILAIISPNILAEEAKRNYGVLKDFNPSVLDKRRQDFYLDMFRVEG